MELGLHANRFLSRLLGGYICTYCMQRCLSLICYESIWIREVKTKL